MRRAKILTLQWALLPENDWLNWCELSSFWLQLRTPRWCHLHKQLQESPGTNLCQEVPSDHHGQTAGVGHAAGMTSVQQQYTVKEESLSFLSPSQRWERELHEASVRYLWRDVQGRSHSHPEESEIPGSARERREAEVHKCFPSMLKHPESEVSLNWIFSLYRLLSWGGQTKSCIIMFFLPIFEHVL